MAMSDNKFNICGLKQCGDINYRFQSHYLTVNIKKSSYTHSSKRLLLGCINSGENEERVHMR